MSPSELVSKYVGAPYADNGRSIEEGFDCWGLSLCAIYDIFGIKLPDRNYQPRSCVETSSKEYYSDVFFNGKDYYLSDYVHEVKKPKYGDFILLNFILNCFPLHVGIYIPTKHQLLHSSLEHGVILTKLHHSNMKIEGIYRLNNDILTI